MIALRLLSIVAWAQGILAFPWGSLLQARQAGNVSEHQEEYYYSFWSEGGGTFRCTNDAGGKYTATWGGSGGFVCGKGWNPGGPRQVKYTGTYDPMGPGYLSIYGWTRDPLVEYYVVESHGDLKPSEPWTPKGNFTFEEGTYELYMSTRVQKPSIVGTNTFPQYWSVRTEARIGGTVSMARHFEAWQNAGMELGTHEYMLVATEGYTSGNVTSSGTSNIAIE